MRTEKRRPWPYVWTTWITGLLSGVDKCHWKIWLKAHYYLPKQEEDPERKGFLSKWIKDHDAMTRKRVASLKQEGYSVFVEDENSFVLRGEVANLAGKPDIIALNKEEKTGLIIDEKAGKQKEQYIWQVLIYMFAKDFTFPDYVLSGEIEYKDERIPIHPRQLNTDNKRRIGGMMRIVGGDEEPERVPSRFECEYCDIIGCPDRYEAKETDATAHF